MSDPMKQAWNDVAETFTSLGRAMKDHYESFEREDVPEDAERPDVGGVRAALDRVVDAGRDLGDRIVGAVSGDDVKAQAKEALHALNQALSATVEIVGEQLTSVVKRSPVRSRDSAPSDAPAETAASDAKASPHGPPPDRDGLGAGAFGDPLP